MSDQLRSQGGFFVQESLDDLYYLLTCTGAGDVAMPTGDETAVYCPDPSSVGDFIITGAVPGEVGFTTYTLTRPLREVVNYLITQLADCRFHGRVNWRAKGSVPDIFQNYTLGVWLYNSKVSNRTLTQPVVITPGENDRVDTNADVNAFGAEMVYPLTGGTRITLTEVSAINGIDFDLSGQCFTEEIGGEAIGKDGYFTTDHTATSPAVNADVWYTTDWGATWTLCAADPFAAAEDAGPVVTRGGRVIVGRITADAGNPAEIAYSDDYGATWANVDLGSTNSQVVNALWWQDWTHLWAACSGGYVYFSEDGGESWTAQTSGGITAQDLNDICAYDQRNVWAVGDTGAIIRTVDGVNWSLVTAPSGVVVNLTAIFMCNSQRVFIGSVAGFVYRTNDGGTNWTAAFGTPSWSGGEVKAIYFDMKYRYWGTILGNTSGGVGQVYRSEQGGAIGSWYRIEDVPTNSGLNDAAIIDHLNFFAGGEPQGGTAFLIKVQPVS